MKDQQLEITTLASTSMACEPELMTQESQFMQALEGVQEFRANGIDTPQPKGVGILPSTTRLALTGWHQPK